MTRLLGEVEEPSPEFDFLVNKEEPIFLVMIVRPARLALIALFALLPFHGLQAAERAPAVVELFTSQGCSSCPPADAFLGQLAQREDVIALAFHVDYWDYIGWKDPFASPKFTERQHLYAAFRGSSQVYTPQMIVNGKQDYIGSRRRQVEKALTVLPEEQRPLLARVTAKEIHLPEGLPQDPPAIVWLASYDAEIKTDVQRGENAGENLIEFNVVRSLEQIGSWGGPAVTLPLETSSHKMAGRSALVVLVQAPRGGPILAAGQLWLK